MSAAPRFSLRAASRDPVATGRSQTSVSALDPVVGKAQVEVVSEPEPDPEAKPRRKAASSRSSKTVRPSTREGARGVTVWVEPEVYRMLKLIGLDAGMTTQDVMMEAIDDLFAKKGKGRIARKR